MSRLRPWRLLDTGVRDAAENIALDSVLLDLRSRGESPDTLRFLQFHPAAALIGRHQTVAQEIRREYCLKNGIDINRRITGGGAVLFDATQIGWELIFSRKNLGAGLRLDQLTPYLCRGLLQGLAILGIDACFRPRNDVEVSGRKICGTGGAYENDAILFQGTLLVDFEVETMIRALRVPTEKLSRRELDSARDRVTCLARLLPEIPSMEKIKSALTAGFASALGADFQPGDLTTAESELLLERLPAYDSQAWINDVAGPTDDHMILNSVYRGEGGLVRTAVSVDIPKNRLKQVLFTGDFFINPAQAVFDLEAGLKDRSLDSVETVIRDYFTRYRPETLQLGADDFWFSLKGALQKLKLPLSGIPLTQSDQIATFGDLEFPQAAAAASVLLLPYCAKLPTCEFRRQDGCDECGECDVGLAYQLARERGMTAISVHDYEDLQRILVNCRDSGVLSVIGCCCHAFLAKRYQTFSESGLSGVIVDISDATCYDLALEEEALRGLFHHQTSLRLELLTRVLDLTDNSIVPCPDTQSMTAAGSMSHPDRKP
ncbi:MAG: lipoyl protein ligase domain-containing protein [Thermoleophilia bacterium]